MVKQYVFAERPRLIIGLSAKKIVSILTQGYVSTVGRNKNAIKKYIEDQLKEDMMSEQMTLKEYVDPFKG